MKKIFLLFSAFACLHTIAQKQPGYKILKTYHIKSPGAWDYLVVNNNKIYVAHETQVNILDEQTGDSVGVIAHTSGVHGIAFDNALNRGYTSNGRSNNVTVFDLHTNKSLAQIATPGNPDAILFEPFSKTIITCNGRGKNLSVIDPASNRIIATIAVGGKPEAAVADGAGKFFVNIEDKNEMVVVDMKTHSVLHHWPLSPGRAPTGLAYDKATKRLFAGCENLLIVMNADDGAVVDKIKIGSGCDGVAFDNQQKLIFTSNGEGTVSMIREASANEFSLLGNYPTKRGARTIALDAGRKEIFLPTANFETTLTKNGRPKMIPGSFQVLVVSYAK